MGRLNTIITSITKPFQATNSPVPLTISGHHHVVAKKVITAALGTLAIVSLLGMAAASQPNDGTAKPHQSSKKASSIELNTEPNDTDPNTSADTSADTPDDSSTPTASNTNSSSVSVNVNGQDIPVPDNGSTQQTITSPDGSSTSVNISSNNDSQGSSLNSSVTSHNNSTFHSSFSSNVHTEHSSSSH